jgi:hypothetical protein
LQAAEKDIATLAKIQKIGTKKCARNPTVAPMAHVLKISHIMKNKVLPNPQHLPQNAQHKEEQVNVR